MGITLLTKDDQRAIQRLFKTVTQVLREKGIHQWDRFYPNRFVIGNDLKQLHLYGIKHAKDVLAVVTVDQHQSKNYQTLSWHGEEEQAACIHRLAVHPAYQGNSLGKQLLAFAEEQAKKDGCRSIRLDVFSANPSAIAMYQKAGYEKRGQIAYPFRKHPYYCFEKSLNES